MISAVLLAAGESRRMGEFKQLLTLDGKTFIERCVDNLLAARVGEVVVVTGYRDEDVRRAVGDRPVRFAHNTDYREGMSSSLKRGVESLSKNARACLIALVDQPQISVDIFNRVIKEYETNQPLIVIPTFEGRNGHPIILDLKLKEEILSLDPAEGLRQVVHAHASEIYRVDVAQESVLMDFDLPEDYRRALNK
ncbi:MAG: nucleotidyltransferase family protein [Blastocatellia bacterium]